MEIKKGIKSDSNKRRYSLLPNGAVNEVVDVLEFIAMSVSYVIVVLVLYWICR